MFIQSLQSNDGTVAFFSAEEYDVPALKLADASFADGLMGTDPPKAAA